MISLICLLSCIMRVRAYIPGPDPGLSDSNSVSARHTLRDVLVAVAIFVLVVAMFYVLDRWLQWDTESRFERMLNDVCDAAVRLYDRMYNCFKKFIAAVRHSGRNRGPPATEDELESGMGPRAEGN